MFQCLLLVVCSVPILLSMQLNLDIFFVQTVLLITWYSCFCYRTDGEVTCVCVTHNMFRYAQMDDALGCCASNESIQVVSKQN